MNKTKAAEHKKAQMAANAIKRLVVFLLKNSNKTICVVIISMWFLIAVFMVGKMPTIENEPYGWDVPFRLLALLLPPVIFAYFAGKDDAIKGILLSEDNNTQQ